MKVAAIPSVLRGTQDPFATAAMLGFEGIEIELAREQLRSSDTKQVERLRDAARSRSLEIHALVLGEHNHGGIASSDPNTAGRAAEEVELAVGWAAELGADVVLVPFFIEAELRGDDDFDRCANAFAALCPLAAGRGVTLCFEGLLPAERIRVLAERAASPAFGCYVDLANPLRRGLDPPTEIRELRELVRRVHVKEMLVRPGDVRPGRGRVDFAECALALEEIGYDGWLTLETPPGPTPLVARDLSFTRSVFPTLGGDPTWPRFGGFSYDFTRGQWHDARDRFRAGSGWWQYSSGASFSTSASTTRGGKPRPRDARGARTTDRRPRRLPESRRAGPYRPRGEHRVHRALPRRWPPPSGRMWSRRRPGRAI